jgi:hypothetical protein
MTVKDKGRTKHEVAGSTYVVDHDTKEVFLEVDAPKHEHEELKSTKKLRATGGDYEKFLSDLPAPPGNPLEAMSTEDLTVELKARKEAAKA